ncbi:hypothetical protein HBI56_200580 [Parastagonospora nodorum]|uniref:Uncharacterized protein n=1 Tax=Phaeosphaeria nodorum (strain SN15 / ATCC MYA-4574 / FGSC 10173) TaxID=321614 RepID=A0A7U2HX35_PHANO|nr:hypothetical protein HBH56_215130 [Parastagonospora nodorum]QRC93823.1 hypothetical protein JI435_156630 [Parastagonospora nodorum SN15]KAH3922699.1 hypothetical protein HBH54_222370 [Parastagonospora nodorum]KAH3942114.1 hypothetical protein HBH53_192280 [Parastagonospora nodorum]KAH3961244.1 hypothetical protein HBH51_183810 [Parastagonospora nodorum]
MRSNSGWHIACTWLHFRSSGVGHYSITPTSSPSTHDVTRPVFLICKFALIQKTIEIRVSSNAEQKSYSYNTGYAIMFKRPSYIK